MPYFYINKSINSISGEQNMPRAKKLETFRIAGFKDVTIEDICQKHLELIVTKENYENMSEQVKELYKLSPVKIKSKPRKKILEEKYEFFIHLIITRSYEREFVPYNAKYLQDLLGNDYKDFIRTLNDLQLIIYNSSYTPGEKACSIKLIDFKIKWRTGYSASFEKYTKKNEKLQNKFNEKLNKIQESVESNKGPVEKDPSLYDENFINQYEKNLNKLKILNKEEAKNFIDNSKFLKPYSEYYYLNIIDEFEKKNKKIIPPTEEKDNRIYSLLTRTPRHLKNFLNIKFQIDISNSHPLLFARFIIEKHSIDFEIIEQLFSIKPIDLPQNATSNREFRRILPNDLQNHIKEKEINIDLIKYIYFTIHGIFWDCFKEIEKFENTPRPRIKINLFTEVFYSKILTSRNQEYKKEFKKIYPAVNKMINDFKEEYKNNKIDHLAHYMMKIESDIFHKILMQLYKKGIIAVNIHDAIIVIDVIENKNVTSDYVIEVIKNVYKEYKLIPTCKIDIFSIDNANNTLKVLNDNQDKLNNLIEDYKRDAEDINNPNKERDKAIYEELSTGKIIIEIDNDKMYMAKNYNNYN